VTTPTAPFSSRWVQRFADGEPAVTSWYAGPHAALIDRARARAAGFTAPLVADELREWTVWLVAHNAPGAAIANAARLAVPGATAVVTGQQTGLFGGPLYTIFKAWGAILHARAIETATGAPCVPVFWVASDDHDFAEAATHTWLDSTGAARTVTIAESPAESGLPMYARPFAAERIAPFIDTYAASVAPSDFLDEQVAFLRACCHESATWESAFVRLTLRLLGDEGLVPLAPRLGFMRRRAMPVIQKDIESRGAFSRMLVASSERLNAAGAQGLTIHRKGDEANFFVAVDGIRGKARWASERLEVTHPASGAPLASFSPAECAALLGAEPGRFSPNAALRPLVQDAALPTAAYIAGPAEMIYHAQIGCLYQPCGVFRPLVLPRPSALLVEPRIARLVSKLGMDADAAVKGGPDAVRRAALSRADGDGLLARTRARLDELAAGTAALRDELHEATADTGLVKAAEKLAQSLDAGAATVVDRLEKLVLRRGEEAASQAAKVIDALWPNGEPQERVLGVLAPLWRANGPGAVRALGSHLAATSPATRVVALADVTAPSGTS